MHQLNTSAKKQLKIIKKNVTIKTVKEDGDGVGSNDNTMCFPPSNNYKVLFMTNDKKKLKEDAGDNKKMLDSSAPVLDKQKHHPTLCTVCLQLPSLHHY